MAIAGVATRSVASGIATVNATVSCLIVFGKIMFVPLFSICPVYHLFYEKLIIFSIKCKMLDKCDYCEVSSVKYIKQMRQGSLFFPGVLCAGVGLLKACHQVVGIHVRINLCAGQGSVAQKFLNSA